MKEYYLYHGISEVPNQASYFKREPLIKLLKNAFLKPLTLITAGAGYGKTESVSHALRGSDNLIVWLELSEIDNVTMRLWERIGLGFTAFDTELADKLMQIEFPTSIEGVNFFINALTQALVGRKLVIVLDDFHLMKNIQIITFFERLVKARIGLLSLVILSREEPPISFSWLTQKNLVTSITEDSFRLSFEETCSYIQMQKITLSDKELLDLYDYTEGWILAVSLIVLSLKNQNVYDSNHLVSIQKELTVLVEKEVFSKCSPGLQQLLIQMSLLNFYPDKLVNILCPDPNIQQEILKQSAFIRYDSYFNCYRIHHLFKEFLMGKQDRIGAALVDKTHRMVGDYYAANCAPADALYHYEKCGNYEGIFAVILTYKNRVPMDIGSLFIRLLENAPQECIDATPIMLVVKAKFIINNDRIAEGYQLLQDIIETYKRMPETHLVRSVLGEAYILLAITYLILRSLKFKEYFQLAEEYLPNGSQLINNKLSLISTGQPIFLEENEPGAIEQTKDAYFSVFPGASKMMNGCGYGIEFLVAGEFAYLEGDHLNGERYLLIAANQAEQQNQTDIQGRSYLYLIKTYLSKGKFSKINMLLKKAKEQKLILEGSIEFDKMIETIFLAQLGIYTELEETLNQNNKNYVAPVTLNGFGIVTCGYYLSVHRYNELLATTEKAIALYVERKILFAQIYSYILRALCFSDMGLKKEAIENFRTAYKLAAPNQIIMPFIEYGSKMRTFTVFAMKDENCGVPHSWLKMIGTKANTFAKRVLSVKSDYRVYHGIQEGISLTTHELEILSDLCQGLTRKEIGAEFNLSEQTVKSMLETIYSKLGANNSLDAIRIVTKMGVEL